MTEVGVGGTTEGNSIMQQNFRCVTSSVTYAVSMTTIPARIPHLRNVVESWLYQGTVQPRYIFIFIPKQYKRFKRKSNGDMGESFKCMAESILVDQLGTTPRYVDVSRDCAHFSGEVTKVADNMNSNTCTTIRVVETEVDWGPATKYVGFMDYRLSWDRKWGVNSPKLPDYWVVGDDDVRYASNTWSLYEAFILNDPVVTEREREAQGEDSPSALVGPYTVLTHFSEDCRQLVHLDREDFTRPVLHLQGVDTVAFPSRLLQMHEEGQCTQAPGERVLPCSLSVLNIKRGLNFVHEHCPSSFYQDDYVISLLVNLGNIDVRSTYLVGRENVARHVDGVSKHFCQMHMSDKVGMREEQTKKCLKDQC